ncbi:hypothetical protein N9903_01525, partial [bacterium]|nr:hypothetical protein [bacterium]
MSCRRSLPLRKPLTIKQEPCHDPVLGERTVPAVPNPDWKIQMQRWRRPPGCSAVYLPGSSLISMMRIVGLLK